MAPRSVTRAALLVVTAGLLAIQGTANAANDDPGACNGLGALGGINNAPLALDDEAWVEPGGTVSIDVVDNDQDFDGDDLIVESVTTPGSGQAVNNNNGTVTYQPGLNFVGEDTFIYRVSDGKCGSDQAQVRVLVDVDPPPPDEADPVTPVVTVPDFTG
ncbi:MAG: hypothetical protein GXP35_15230 [Actinobacteria bacterium]|nr:hypothetical protein [Actinomycetota bacterium]